AEAARRLGRSPDTLRLWHDDGHMPAVVTPGGQWSTYQSFIDAVLASARPKQAGQIEKIARDWFAAHASEAVALWTGPPQTTAASARSPCGSSISVLPRERRASGQ